MDEYYVPNTSSLNKCVQNWELGDLPLRAPESIFLQNKMHFFIIHLHAEKKQLITQPAFI